MNLPFTNSAHVYASRIARDNVNPRNMWLGCGPSSLTLREARAPHFPYRSPRA